MNRSSSIAGRGWSRYRSACIRELSTRTADSTRLRGGNCCRRRHLTLSRSTRNHPPASTTAAFSTHGEGGGDGRAPAGSPNSADAGPFHFRLPPPTWSVSDLQLGVDHEPVKDEVLVALCRRACVLVPPPTEATGGGGNNINEDGAASMREMAQDVGNLLHMLRQVRSIDPSLAASLLDSKDEDERARLLYDVPRGLSPIVFDDCDDDDDDNENSTSNSEQQEGSEGGAAAAAYDEETAMEIDRVREAFLRPKMVQVGGHSYFVARTGRPRTCADDDAANDGNRR